MSSMFRLRASSPNTYAKEIYFYVCNPSNIFSVQVQHHYSAYKFSNLKWYFENYKSLWEGGNQKRQHNENVLGQLTTPPEAMAMSLS